MMTTMTTTITLSLLLFGGWQLEERTTQDRGSGIGIGILLGTATTRKRNDEALVHDTHAGLCCINIFIETTPGNN